MEGRLQYQLDAPASRLPEGRKRAERPRTEQATHSLARRADTILHQTAQPVPTSLKPDIDIRFKLFYHGGRWIALEWILQTIQSKGRLATSVTRN